MPTLENTESVGFPRIYGLVFNLISLVNGQITDECIFQFVKSYQKVSPLTIGELWGIPIMLRLGLIENIRLVCDEIISSRKDRNVADVWADKLLDAADKSSKDVVQVLYTMSQSIPKISHAFVLQILQRLQGSDPLLSVITTWLEQQLSTQGLDVDDINRAERYTNHLNLIRLRNSIISLRFVNSYSWKEFVEELSSLESILRKDPTGIYAKQDFETRDMIRRAVEGIAKANKKDEKEVAQAALRLAKRAHNEYLTLQGALVNVGKNEKTILDFALRKSFVGYYLLDEHGLHVLKTAEKYKIDLLAQLSKQYHTDMNVVLFIAAICFFTLIFVWIVLGLMASSIKAPGVLTYLYYLSGSSGFVSILFLLLSLTLTGSQLAVGLVNSIIVHVLKPRLVPRMDFKDGVPEEFRTMVVVPTMITSLDGANELITDLRARFLVNRDHNIYYALLTDWADAKTEKTANDDTLLNEVVKGIEGLNQMYPNVDGAAPFFYLFHRPRKYNAQESVWMAWERKRGKLTQFTQALRDVNVAKSNAFYKVVGDVSILNTMQFVITLDTDTMLPADAARKMIGHAAHILNKPISIASYSISDHFHRTAGLAQIPTKTSVSPSGNSLHVPVPSTPLTGATPISPSVEASAPHDAQHPPIVYNVAELVKAYETLLAQEGNVIHAGYGLLQPRVSVGLSGAHRSLYSLINSLDSGLDPYTRFVSDVYQDAFGEGSFIGKGLYHVDAFLNVFSNLFPENRILSHDLIEGCYVRSGLVSDVELIEEYPSSYLTEASRRHRWVRGDWQIASWILPFVPSNTGGYTRNPLSILARWKIFDNLRRSLVPLAMCYLVAFSWLVSSGAFAYITLPYVALMSVLSVWFIPAALDLTEELINKQEDVQWQTHFSLLWNSLLRRVMMSGIDILFLPFEAYNNVDAIVRCLARITVTKKLLLEWNTSSSAAKAYAKNQVMLMFRTLWTGPAFSLVSLLVLLVYGFFNSENALKVRMEFSYTTWLWNAVHVLFFIVLWAGSPMVAWYLSAPTEAPREIENVRDLTDAQVSFLRVLTRKTWRFFETFVREEDNFLPLDNYQEFPKPMLARRTSPTNIAMALLNNVTAWDFGYVPIHGAAKRIERTLAAMSKMERYHGHFYNWYDTSDLRPLAPRYVSSVDSGNLIGYLVILATALEELASSPVYAVQFYHGVHDTLACIEELQLNDLKPMLQQLKDMLKNVPRKFNQEWKQWMNKFKDKCNELSKQSKQAVDLLQENAKQENQGIDDEIMMESIEGTRETNAHYYVQSLLEQLNSWEDELTKLLGFALIPTTAANDGSEAVKKLVAYLEELNALNELPENFTTLILDPIDEWNKKRITVKALIETIAPQLNTLIADAKQGAADSVLVSYLTQLEATLAQNVKYAEAQVEKLLNLSKISSDMSNQDFNFLYNQSRNLISIGFNVDHNRLDNAYYDTFCSEARLCSYVMIAKRQLPVKHWFAMSRLLTAQAAQKPALLSWSGSMFEYLMPLLVMPNIAGTLLHQTYQSVVMRQIEYGQQKKVPWGISESAYNMMDAYLVYQYGPFGVPGLGLKRGLSNDLVVAPYASALALMVLPAQACKNLERLSGMGLLGTYGLYESVDFTPHRLRGLMPFQPIRSYFAHHQGMSFLSLAYALRNKPNQRRFSATAELHANELLLQEKIPRVPFILNPNEKEATRWNAAVQNAPSSNRRFQGLQMFAPPEIHLLSNGSLHVMVSAHGAGYINYKDTAVTRWREDVTCDSFGPCCYLRDVEQAQLLWSTTSLPIVAPHNSNYSVMFSQGKAEFKRNEHGIVAQTTVTVSPHDNVEVRRVSLSCSTGAENKATRRIEVTSYSEVVLGSARTDASHRAFSNLFIKSEVLEEYSAILVHRQGRSKHDKTMFGYHIMLLHDARNADGKISFEVDRSKFIGRGHSYQAPRAMQTLDALGAQGSKGAIFSLDPIFAIRQVVKVKPGSIVHVDFITGVADSREEALKIIAKYQKKRFTNHVIDYSWINAQKLNFKLGITEIEAQQFGKLAGCLLYSNPRYRASPRLIAKNRSNQSFLWRLAISGDLPIILVRISDVQNIELVAQCLQAHAYMRANGLICDLVIWNDETSSYRDDLHSNMLSLIGSTGETAHMLQKPGGIFPVRGESLNEQESILLYSVARVVLSDTGGRMVDQINRDVRKENSIPALLNANKKREQAEKQQELDAAAAAAAAAAQQEAAASSPQFSSPASPIGSNQQHHNNHAGAASVMGLDERDLLFNNSYGGFDKKRREYVISLQDKVQPATPAPWCNILANEQIGTVISEKGSAYTWFENAHEFRLTPWNNDQVVDPCGEAYFIRDEDTGKYWSPMMQPCPSSSPYIVRHGMGYSAWEHVNDGVRTETTVFVPQTEPIKVVMVMLKNQSGRTRNLTVTGFVEWALGELRDRTHQNIITNTEVTPTTTAILARNPYHVDFTSYVGFFSIVDHKCTVTADRSEFIGFNRTISNPAALERLHLSGTVGAALDPCAAIQTAPITLENGKSMEVAFILGAQRSNTQAKDLIERIRSTLIVRQLLKNVKAYWTQTLSAVTVETPDASVDVMTNGWLLYQVLSSRIWGRSGFYQSSGAFGFRDQLQDSMSVVYSAPHILRQQIIACCEHQFERGDVLHWWHPQSNRGTRTTFSDDYLWLPLAVAHYIDVTGDKSLLHVDVKFATGIREVPIGEESHFDQVRPSEASGTIYEHCKRAIKYGLKFGEHGIPLMGCGDWNDGMNLVGIQGKGESVWLAFFLVTVMDRFSKFATPEDVALYKQYKQQITAAVEDKCWDGAWYTRAFFDNGEPLGSAKNTECQIDSLPQSWGILSGVARSNRVVGALDNAYKRLVRKDWKLIQLFDPAFDPKIGNLDPGYIKGYAPGVRENGGQYTHAAIWMVWAYSMLRSPRAWELFDLINPVNHALDRRTADMYRVEPFVIAADIYTLAGREGQGGWTWYTGSSGWAYRLLIEQFFGLKREEGNILTIQPFPKPDWVSYKVTYRHHKATYNMVFTNMKHESMPAIVINDDDANNYIAQVLNLNELQKKGEELSDAPIGNMCKPLPLVIFLDGKIVKGNQIELKDESANHTVQVYYEL